MVSIRSIRRLSFGAVVALAAHAAGAQTVTAAYAPTCGPGTACGTVRFTLSNAGGTTLEFNALTLTSSGAPFVFASAGGNAATYEAVDVFGPFGGAGTLNVGRTTFSINFLDTGAPLTLGPAFAGYVELQLAGVPALPPSGAFQYSALLAGSATPVTGAITSAATVPEPATFALVGGGLVLVAAARRRRAA